MSIQLIKGLYSVDFREPKTLYYTFDSAEHAKKFGEKITLWLQKNQLMMPSNSTAFVDYPFAQKEPNPEDRSYYPIPTLAVYVFRFEFLEGAFPYLFHERASLLNAHEVTWLNQKQPELYLARALSAPALWRA